MKLIDKIKKSNIARLIKSKSIIKDLESKIGVLEEEKKELIDNIKLLEKDKKKLLRQVNKIPNIKEQLEELLKNQIKLNKDYEKLEEDRLELETALFENNLELTKYKIQCEEYELQIQDYKTEGRYLIKTLKPDRTKSRIKTKISMPMKNSVVKHMRGEHE